MKPHPLITSTIILTLTSCQPKPDTTKEFIEFKLDNKPYKITVGSRSSMSADYYGRPYFQDKPSSRKLYALKTSFIGANVGDM